MITLTPAYGRDYNSIKAVITDLESNKDFILNDFTSRYDGKPCSPLTDFPKDTLLCIRYARLTKITTYKVK